MPASLEAERGFLGALELDVAKLGVAREALKPEHFHSKAHRMIFEAMLGIDDTRPLTVAAELEKRGQLELVGGRSYIASLFDGLSAAPDLEKYAAEIRQDWMRRDLARVGQRLATMAVGARVDPAELAADASAHLADLARRDGAPPPVRSLAELLADPEALRPPRVVAPRVAYRARVTMLAGREKGGKSTFATALTAAVTRGAEWLEEPTEGPAGVLWIAADEHPLDLARRMHEWGADPERVFVLSGGDLGPDPLAAMRAAVEHVRPALVVVDALVGLVEVLQLDSGSASAWQPIMARIARIARESGAAVVLIHHARKSDGRYRDSTAIGAAVDAILELSEGDLETERRIRVLARWRFPHYVVRLEGTRYLLATAPATLTERVLAYVEANPGASMRQVRASVRGSAQAIGDAVEELLGTELEDHGGPRGGRALYLSVTGSATGSTPPEPLPAVTGSSTGSSLGSAGETGEPGRRGVSGSSGGPLRSRGPANRSPAPEPHDGESAR